MINEPVALTADGFQQVWIDAVRLLMNTRWELRNLMVQIRNPSVLDQNLHERITGFARREGLLGPKHVAYTIFPRGLYRRTGNAEKLFEAYNRRNGLFERLHRRKPNWGTYFRRMTHYDKRGDVVNQLGNIIKAIQTRQNSSKAAYAAIIQNPGGETVRPLGGPCLNYVAIQLEAGEPIALGLLAVYRNHDFLERAYGNYWGLCNLLQFLAREVEATVGPLTCVSSRAYVSGSKTRLKQFVEDL
jgi:hypothetical protein